MFTLVQTGGAKRIAPPFFKTRKLAIIGCTLTHRYAPWRDPSWTIASHCSAASFCRRQPDWYFDLHPRSCFERSKPWNAQYYDWLKRLTVPIFMQEEWPEIPMAVRYPLERVGAEYRPYFTNHVAYLVALAMTEGLTHIGLFGCEYRHDSEYGRQRGSCEYWLGRFEQAGGQLVLPSGCNLLRFPDGLYGYDSHDREGKLKGDYRVKPTVTVKDAAGVAQKKELQLLAQTDPKMWVPLAEPPPGVRPLECLV